MNVLAALIVSLMAAYEPDRVRAGVMVASADRPVLALEGAPLAVGTVVTVVGIEEPQQVWQGSIRKPLPSSDLMARHAPGGPLYELTFGPNSPPLPNVAVGIQGSAEVTRQGGTVTLRFGALLPSVRVRSCASSEGLHLTLWAGTPLKSPRLWHTYYYLGYDVEPTCTPADIAAANEALQPTAPQSKTRRG